MADSYTIRTVTVGEDDIFELEDNERVVDTVIHGSRVKVFILSPDHFQCGYIKEAGDPCKMTVSGPDERCHHHD